MQSFFTWLWQWIRDVSLGVVLVVCLFAMLAAASGVWPPLTVVESGSMEPSINQGDITVVTTTDRFTPDHADQYGVVTHDVGAKHGVEYFGDYGSVIVFEQPGATIPTIHRAMFYVEEGENWYSRVNPEYTDDALGCADLEYCPAPNSGYITKGDNNDYYDQEIGLSPPVDNEWIIGVSHLRIPYLGWIRLIVDFLA